MSATVLSFSSLLVVTPHHNVLIGRSQLRRIVVVRRHHRRMRRRRKAAHMLHVRAVALAAVAAAALHVLVQHGKDLAVEHLEAANAIDHALEFLSKKKEK